MEPVVAGHRFRVAIISDSEARREVLADLLRDNGLHVTVSRSFARHGIEEISPDRADVLLLDLDDEKDYELDFLDEVLESRLPVLFNDSAGSQAPRRADSVWGRLLVRKLGSVVGDRAEDAAEGLQAEAALPVGGYAGPATESRPPVEPLPGVQAARNVWVLGASIGGPQAVKCFLAALPGDLPVAFVLAQHIGSGFVSVLAHQLNRATEFDVRAAEAGYVLKHREVLIAPVEERIQFDRNGRVVLEPANPNSLYSPCIDDVIVDTAVRYGRRSGALIFSGMGSDGMRGCRVMAARGGVVWAQEPSGCVISSMPDSVRRAGLVSFSGTPEQMAQELVSHFAT